jgi:GTP-binding protein
MPRDRASPPGLSQTQNPRFCLPRTAALFHPDWVSGLIAIVGRPNVGKSALFNRVVGRRIAIVHDQPGVTRDRITAEAEWMGRGFTLVDTGGIGLLRGEKSADVLIEAAFQQVQIALDSAHVIILVVNVQEGIVPLDLEVAQRLRTSGKPVLVAVNKVDHPKVEPNVAEFTRLGFPKMFPVSAIHGLGIDDLMAGACALLPADTASASKPVAEGEGGELPAQAEAGPLRLAIVGRPNVGKSSIINALTHSERVIVTPIPGTTRDSVDVPFEIDTDGVRERYMLVDTAGMRKRRRVDDSVEFFSVKRSEEAIERSDIAVLVLDAEAGILEQDKKVADHIVEQRRACIVVVNKWDLVEDQVAIARDEELQRRHAAKRRERGQRRRLTTLGEFGLWVQEKLFFLDYAPVIFTSATEGFQLERLLEAVRYVAAQLRQKVPTAILNRTIQDAIERRQPVTATGEHLRFFYATQVSQAPPTFLLFVNRDRPFSPAYAKYLGGEIRRAFGYEGCPIILVPKARPKTIEPVRKFKSQALRHPHHNRRTGGAAGARRLNPRRGFRSRR